MAKQPAVRQTRPILDPALGGTVVYSSDRYQVVELPYRDCELLKKVPKVSDPRLPTDYPSVHMQGDEADAFLAELRQALSRHVAVGLIDHRLSEYDAVLA